MLSQIISLLLWLVLREIRKDRNANQAANLGLKVGNPVSKPK